MNELARLLNAWTEWREQGDGSSAILATVVKVEGSAYRRPGARMLLLPGRGGVGVISGGCLERHLTDNAWLLTQERSVVRMQYDTQGDADAFFGFGAGCRGVIHVLLERLDAGAHSAQMEFFEGCRRDRRPGLMATVVAAEGMPNVEVGNRLMVFPDATERSSIGDLALQGQVRDCVQAHSADAQPRIVRITTDAGTLELFAEVIRPPVRLLVFGAGPDAPPLVHLAKELGWEVNLIDTRSAFLSRERFPLADELIHITPSAALRGVRVEPGTAAVIMSHDFVQDLAVLEALVTQPLQYLGVLGPRDRTQRLLRELSSEARECAGAALRSLHAPVGLDIGAETPEEIALAIAAEIQATLRGRGGRKLRDVAGHTHGRQAGEVEGTTRTSRAVQA